MQGRGPGRRLSFPEFHLFSVPRLTRQQARRLSVNQNMFIEDLTRHLGGNDWVINILADQPTIGYNAAFRDCVVNLHNSQELIISIKFFLDGRWQIAGPATTRDDKLIVVPNARKIINVWYVGDYIHTTGKVATIRREVKFKHAGPGFNQW
jgi:hypothetical protein